MSSELEMSPPAGSELSGKGMLGAAMGKPNQYR